MATKTSAAAATSGDSEMESAIVAMDDSVMENGEDNMDNLTEEDRSNATSTSIALDEEEEDDDDSFTAGGGEDNKSVATTPIPTVIPKKKREMPQIPASSRRGRAPAVSGLTIPFRTVKKAMKLDPDIPIVQSEAAIMTTLAAELFLKRLALESHKICQKRKKNTIRYEDVADARSNDPSLAFLKTGIP